MNHAIAARGLRRTYGRGDDAYEAVRGIDLDVEEGEVFALLGTNGAGKTSTLDLLEGLAVPDGGEVAVLGLDPRRDRRELRPQIGTMLQSGGLPAELTVAEALRMWRGTCSNPSTVDAVVDATRLDHRVDVRVGHLSGGEQRRVDLACALLGQPRLLFLDEPTTGLDPESRHATWSLLADLNVRGMTMVLTTHYLDEAQSLAHHIAIMHRGVVARRGTLDDIVADHPATISFDDPGPAAASLPVPAGTHVETGPRLTMTTRNLQDDLWRLLEWARARDLHLTGLEAHHASLESVFLDLAAEDDGPAKSSPGPVPTPIPRGQHT